MPARPSRPAPSRPQLPSHLARDHLTGLGSRAAFLAAVDARHGEGRRVTVVLADLDDFRAVNDVAGHVAGDTCLVRCADRVRQSVGADTAAFRLGDDQFAVLLDDVDVEAGVRTAERLLDALAQPLALAGAADAVELTACAGIATSSATEPSTSALLKAAYLAMHRAKERGRGTHWVFGPELEQAALARQSLHLDLRAAVRDRLLRLVYQPIVDLSDGRLLGVEALVRWTHPERGSVPPSAFVPLAEETGLIVELGEQVLRQACAQLLAWDAAGGDPGLQLSVNVSTRQLEQRGLLGAVDDCLDSGVDPSRLCLEVTETALAVDAGTADETLHALRNRGVRLAVDDFGQGQSSLARLRSAPVSRLKIDRAFVHEIARHDSDAPLVTATLAMARGLGLGVVAEGIETAEQLRFLRAARCPAGQGYLLAKPAEAAAVLALMWSPPPWTHLFAHPPAAGPAAEDPEIQQLVELAISPTVSLEALVRPLLAVLRRRTSVSTAYLTELDELARTGVVRFATSEDSGVDLQEGTVGDWAESLCVRALADGPRRTSSAQTAFAGTDVAADLGLSAYLMSPVSDPSGRLYGTLCAVSREPVALSAADTALVDVLAGLVSQKLTLLGADPQGGPGQVRGAGDGPVASRQRRAQQAWAAAQAERRAAVAEDARRGGDLVAARGALDFLDGAQEAFHDHQAQARDAPSEACGRRRVVIVDDDPLMLGLLAAFVEADPRLWLAGQADSACRALGMTIAEQPDILVLDYELGGGATTDDIIGDLRLFAPGTRILLHSGRRDVHQIGQRLDVDRTVSKGQDVARLVEALGALAG